MLGDLRPYKMRDIIAYFADGTHDDELDEAHLYERDDSGQVRLDSEFYLLPYWKPEYGELPEIETFAHAQGLDPDEGLLGQQFTDVLREARRQRPDATDQDYLDAYNHYLNHDNFLDWPELQSRLPAG
jgi:hypothetical protein